MTDPAATGLVALGVSAAFRDALAGALAPTEIVTAERVEDLGRLLEEGGCHGVVLHASSPGQALVALHRAPGVAAVVFLDPGAAGAAVDTLHRRPDTLVVVGAPGDVPPPPAIEHLGRARPTRPKRPTPGDAVAQLTASMEAIWATFRPATLARLDALDAALEDDADADARNRGITEAHKLAGSLGTFGLHTATDDARAIEERLEAPGPLPSAVRDELRALARRVREAVERGPG